MGKTRDTKVFSVRLADDLLAKLKLLADKEHRYMNQQVEYIIEKYFDSIDEDDSSKHQQLPDSDDECDDSDSGKQYQEMA